MSVRHLIVAVFLMASVAVLVDAESSASAQWRRRYRGRVTPPLFKAEYDMNGRITNIPDPSRDPENYAKYFIWQRDANNDHKLSVAEAKLPPAVWSNYNTNRDEFLDLKEVVAMIKDEVAKITEAEKLKAEKAEAAKKLAEERLAEARRIAAEKAEAAKAKKEEAEAAKRTESSKPD